MKPFKIITCLFLIFSVIHIAHGQSEEKKKEIREESLKSKAAFLKADPEMSKFFSKSYGYVIFPNVGKGGMGVGGAHGNGTVYQGGKVIGMAKLAQVTVGFQLGGQSYQEVIFFESKEYMDRFKENKVELSAQVSAVAAAAGASVDAPYFEGVAVFTLQNAGLMYEASVGGQKFKFEPL